VQGPAENQDEARQEVVDDGLHTEADTDGEAAGDDREVFQPEPEGFQGEEGEERPQPVGDARLHGRDQGLVDLVGLGGHAVQERAGGRDGRPRNVEHADDKNQVHHVERGGPDLHAGTEVVPQEQRAAGHGDDPEHHAAQDEQQHDGRDEGRDESREHAALGVLLTVLHVRGTVEDLEQADDELRVDGEAVDEDEHEDRHTRPADGGDGHAEPDGQPVDVQQVVFDAGKLARVQFFEDVQRNQAHRDPAQGEDAAGQVGVADQDAEA